MMQAYVVVYYRHMDYRHCVCVRVRGCDVCVAPQFGWLVSNVSGFDGKHAAMKCLHPNPSQKTAPVQQNEKNKHIVMLVPMVDLMHTEMPWNALTLAARCQLKSCYKVDTMLVLTYGLQALCLSEFHAAAPKNLAWEHSSYTIHQKSNPSNHQTKVDFLLLSNLMFVWASGQRHIQKSFKSGTTLVYVWHRDRWNRVISIPGIIQSLTGACVGLIKLPVRQPWSAAEEK